MLDYEALGDAAWDNDALADEGHSAPSVLTTLGADPDDTVRVAHQRALRMVLIQRGDVWAREVNRAAYEKRAGRVKLTKEEHRTVMMFAAVWLDGVCAGLRASQPKED